MPDWTTHSVLTDDDLDNLVALCGRAKFCAFDFETASEAPVKKPGLHHWHRTSRVVSGSFTFDLDPDAGYVVPLSHPDGPFGSRWREVLRRIMQALVDAEVRLIAHHGKYDGKWVIAHTGVDIAPRLFWDTENSAHLLNENVPTRLKVRASHLMEDGDWGIDVTAAETVPWFDLAVYNAGDTVATYRLYESHLKSMQAPQNEGIKTVFTKITAPATRAIMHVEAHGMMLDQSRTMRALYEATDEATKAEHALMEQARSWGLNPDDFKTVSWEPTALWFLAFMDEAVGRDALPVVEMTGKGRPSWRKGVLNKIALMEPNPLVDHLLAYRHGAKQAQFLQSWLDHCDSRSMVHPTFRMSTTVTGRTSSANPNAQQISRELKPCWRAPEGWHFAEVDYSQIELRMCAEVMYRLLGDNPMLRAYLDGDDLHTLIAAMVAGIDPSEVTKDQRQSGKAVNFGFLFGMGAAKFVDYALETYGVVFTKAEAEEVRRLFFKQWDGLQQYHDEQRAKASRFGYVENLYGRKRHLPAMFTGDDYERSTAERQAINSPIQSSASDTMLRAIAVINHRMDRDVLRLVGTVHDSVLLWVREGHEDALETACNIMLDPALAALGTSLTVPIEVEADLGTHWGEPEKTLVFSTR